MLIDRDKAILKCQERLYESALNNAGVECKADEVFSDIAQNRIKDWLEELPSAERVGHWVDYTDTTYANCSECGRQIDTHYERGYMNYCPNCGAKMEGEEE